MLAAIQFNGQFLFRTVEIDNKISNAILTNEF